MQRATRCRTALLRLTWLAGVAVVAPTGASGQPVDVNGPEVGSARIAGYIYVNVKTGEVVRTPAGPVTRRGGDYWRNDDIAGSCDLFMLQDLPTRDPATGRVRYGSAVVDWGDIAGGASVNGFDIAYATDVGVDPGGAGVAGFDLNVGFLDDYDGELDPGGTGASGISVITLQDIPGGAGPGAPLGWVYVVDLEGSGQEFNWSSTDLNGDGLHDFGYSYSFDQNQAAAKGVAGPFLVRPFSLGGSGTATGSVDLLEWFNEGDDLTGYAGPIWFGGGSCPARPYASTYLTVYGSTGSQSLTAFGRDFTAVGAATLEELSTPAGDIVRVHLPGTGSEEGVVIPAGDVKQLSLSHHIQTETPPGAYYEVRLHDATGYNSVRFVRGGHGFFVRPDFTHAGAMTYTAFLYNDGELLTQRSDLAGNDLFIRSDEEFSIFCYTFKNMPCSIHHPCYQLVKTDKSASVIPPREITVEGDTFLADMIHLTADAAVPSDPAPVIAVETVASGIDFLDIEGVQVGAGVQERDSVPGHVLAGHPYRALGDARLTGLADATGLRVSEIGPGGADGVRAEFGKGGSCDFSFLPIDPGGAAAVGSTIRASATGGVGDNPDHPLGWLSITKTPTPGYLVEADYSAIGSPTQLVQIASKGVVVASFPGHSGPVGRAFAWPIGAGKLARPEGTGCIVYPFPFGTQFVIDSQIFSGDELRVLSESPTRIDYLTSFSINASGIAEITISDGQVGPAPCPADLNGDGLVDFSDYLEFLNLYDAGDPRVDFNGDGLVDFSDYLEFLNLYDAGC